MTFILTGSAGRGCGELTSVDRAWATVLACLRCGISLSGEKTLGNAATVGVTDGYGSPDMGAGNRTLAPELLALDRRIILAHGSPV